MQRISRRVWTFVLGGVILLCVLYFVGGYLAVRAGLMPSVTYSQYSGVVGGLASAVGLFSLLRVSVSRASIEDLEIESLKRLADTAEEFGSLVDKQERTRSELEQLETQKAQMEALVRKASLSFYLQEQRKHQEEIVLGALKANRALSKALDELPRIDDALSTLDVEIESDPNVELLRSVIAEAERKRRKREQDSSSGGCYITTAICSSLGRPDDCEELQLVREFRDSYVAGLPNGPAVIREYYETAPALVAEIETWKDSRGFLRSLCDDFLSPLIEAYKEGDAGRAMLIYVAMTRLVRDEASRRRQVPN